MSKNLLEQRAESIAYIWLTQSPDLVVESQPLKRGVDLLVRWKTKPGQCFGVIVKTSSKPFLRDGLGKIEAPRKVATELVHRSEFYPFPVLSLWYVNNPDHRYFAWIKAGNQEENDLQGGKHLTLLPIENRTFREILETVQNWYSQSKI